MEGTFENELDVQLFCRTLARILGEKHGVTLTATACPKVRSENQEADISA